METHSLKMMVKQYVTMIKKGVILFDYPIQRSDEQWSKKQKSDLIHSALIGLPVPPIYFLSYTVDAVNKNNEPVKDTIRQALDGQQRLTNFYSFVNDGYKLQEYKPVRLSSTNEEYDISNKRFSEMEDEVKDAILSFGIPSYTVLKELASDEEIELLFDRLNASKPLTPHQKAKATIGIRFQSLLNDICNHTTILELSNFPAGQIRDNKHQTSVLQAMMILEDYDYKSFSAVEMMKYAGTIRDDFDNKVIVLEKVEKGLDYLNEVFTEREKFILKAVSFPMTVALSYRCAEDKIEPDMFYLWATSFVDAVNGVESNIPTNYIEHTKNGSTDLKKVKGRIDEMNRHFNVFIEMMK